MARHLIIVSFAFLGTILQRPAYVHGGNSSFASSVTQIPLDLYHTSGSLLKEISVLVGRHTDKLSMEFIRASNMGYRVEVPVVTYWHVKKNGKNDSQYRILLVVPMENVKGRELVEVGHLCERRNAGRGVDLNRNWSVDWGKKEKDYDPYEENPGAAPFSEPEAQAMRMLSKSFKPHIWVNVHSGMEALFMPYDYKSSIPDGLLSLLTKSMLKDLNHGHFQDRCLVGSGGGSIGYLAHGTTTDYMHEIAKVPLSFTFEIYGDANAPSKDCFRMFNPVDSATFRRVMDEWCGALLAIFMAGPKLLRSTNITATATVAADGVGWISAASMDELDFEVREMRAYSGLFVVSFALLVFMVCSRFLKSRHSLVL